MTPTPTLTHYLSHPRPLDSPEINLTGCNPGDDVDEEPNPFETLRALQRPDRSRRPLKEWSRSILDHALSLRVALSIGDLDRVTLEADRLRVALDNRPGGRS